MADEEQQTNEANPTEETPSEEEVQYVSMEEYKNLQRKLSSKDRAEREMRKQLAEITTRMHGEDARSDKMISAFVEALSSNDLVDTSKLKQVLETSKSEKQNNEFVARAMGELAEVVGEDNFNTDEKYETARSLWQSGRVMEAVAEAKRVNTPESQAIDVEELSRQIRADIMKDLGKTDTGETTSTSARKKSSEELAKVDTRKMTPAQLKAHQAEIMAAMESESGVKLKR